MDLAALRLADQLGGQLVSGPAPDLTLLLLERVKAHGLPCLLVLGRTAADLEAPLKAMAGSRARINLIGALPVEATRLPQALAFHRTTIGSIVGAVDAGVPWPASRPMMPKRFPGRIRAPRPLDLAPAPLRPLELGDLAEYLGASAAEAMDRVFLLPPWVEEAAGYVATWWPGVPKPEGAEIVCPHLTLPSSTPFTETLRSALRLGSVRPVPWLPHPGDPSALQALTQLTPEVAAFQGSAADWGEALDRLAELPAPPHFCSRC